MHLLVHRRRTLSIIYPPCYPILTKVAGQHRRGQGPKHRRGDVMTIKNVVIPLEIEYLQKAAKERGISRSKLVRVLMEKVVRDELVPKILNDDDLAHAEAPQQRYRRFRDRRQPTKPSGYRGSF